jgi:hypothetical protein
MDTYGGDNKVTQKFIRKHVGSVPSVETIKQETCCEDVWSLTAFKRLRNMIQWRGSVNTAINNRVP